MSDCLLISAAISHNHSKPLLHNRGDQHILSFFHPSPLSDLSLLCHTTFSYLYLFVIMHQIWMNYGKGVVILVKKFSLLLAFLWVFSNSVLQKANWIHNWGLQACSISSQDSTAVCKLEISRTGWHISPTTLVQYRHKTSHHLIRERWIRSQSSAFYKLLSKKCQKISWNKKMLY